MHAGKKGGEISILCRAYVCAGTLLDGRSEIQKAAEGKAYKISGSVGCGGIVRVRSYCMQNAGVSDSQEQL